MRNYVLKSTAAKNKSLSISHLYNYLLHCWPHKGTYLMRGEGNKTFHCYFTHKNKEIQSLNVN